MKNPLKNIIWVLVLIIVAGLAVALSFRIQKENTLDQENKHLNDALASSTISLAQAQKDKNDLVDALDNFEVYNQDQVKDLFEKYISNVERSQLDPIIDTSAHIFRY